MKNIMEKIIKRAQEEIKTIVLPEAEDERVLKAARDVTDKKIANIILVGNTEVVQDKATKIGIDISDIKLVDPSVSEKYEEYVDCLFELRKQKGLTKEQAEKLAKEQAEKNKPTTESLLTDIKNLLAEQNKKEKK